MAETPTQEIHSIEQSVDELREQILHKFERSKRAMDELRKMIADQGVQLAQVVGNLSRLTPATLNQGETARTPARVENTLMPFGRIGKVEFPRFNGEDFLNWLYRCERFFEFEGIVDEWKLRLVVIHLYGKALLWHRTFLKDRGEEAGPLTWAEYLQAMNTKFDEQAYEECGREESVGPEIQAMDREEEVNSSLKENGEADDSVSHNKGKNDLQICTLACFSQKDTEADSSDEDYGNTGSAKECGPPFAIGGAPNAKEVIISTNKEDSIMPNQVSLGNHFFIYQYCDKPSSDQLLSTCLMKKSDVETDILFSMNGDSSLMLEFARPQKKHGYFLVNDDVRRISACCKNEREVAKAFNCIGEVNLNVGTLCRFACCLGGFKICSKRWKPLILTRDSSIIFSTATPVLVLLVAVHFIFIVPRKEAWRRRKWRVVMNYTIPLGIKALTKYVHNMRNVVTKYLNAGYFLCNKTVPTLLDHEEHDAKAFTAWTIGYLSVICDLVNPMLLSQDGVEANKLVNGLEDLKSESTGSKRVQTLVAKYIPGLSPEGSRVYLGAHQENAKCSSLGDNVEGFVRAPRGDVQKQLQSQPLLQLQQQEVFYTVKLLMAYNPYNLDILLDLENSIKEQVSFSNLLLLLYWELYDIQWLPFLLAIKRLIVLDTTNDIIGEECKLRKRIEVVSRTWSMIVLVHLWLFWVEGRLKWEEHVVAIVFLTFCLFVSPVRRLAELVRQGFICFSLQFIRFLFEHSYLHTGHVILASLMDLSDYSCDDQNNMAIQLIEEESTFGAGGNLQLLTDYSLDLLEQTLGTRFLEEGRNVMAVFSWGRIVNKVRRGIGLVCNG